MCVRERRKGGGEGSITVHMGLNYTLTLLFVIVPQYLVMYVVNDSILHDRCNIYCGLESSTYTR